MTKKHTLQSEITLNYKIIGISSPQKDYRMCWLLNRQLGIELKRVADFCFTPAGSDQDKCFSVYYYGKPFMRLHIYVLANRNDEFLVFSQPRGIDYLMIFRQPSAQLNLDEMVKSIREIPQVHTAFLLPEQPDKKASAFLFDFELSLKG